ncbi:MAG: TolC family protein [Bacteroidales bacterium]|nr:TolC family protein [Bacteroidales bacterium]
MKNRRIYIMITAATLLFTGCNLYRKYQSDATVRNDVMGDVVNPQDTVSMGNMDWRSVFTDPQLQRLIETALTNNTDMRSAQLSIEQAQNSVKSAKWGYAPMLSFTPNATYAYQGGSSFSAQIPISASWQIGIFGQTTTGVRKAKAQVAYAEDYKQAVQVSLAANVANLYYTLVMLDRELEIEEQTEQLWEESLESTRALFDAGIYESPAVYQMEASVSSVKTEIIDLRNTILTTEASLCNLLAEPPHHIERASFGAFRMPEQLHLGLPVRLLDARPDVRLAERNMEFAYYSTQQARQSFYPTLTIEGLFGAAFSPAQMIGQAVASLTQPILEAGKLSAQLKNAKLDQEKARLEFEQALLDAGKEVYTYVHNCQTAEQKAELIANRVNSLQQAYDATSALMQHGSTTYLEVLTAQESLLSAQLMQVQNQYEGIQSLINLYSALGGFGSHETK